MQEALIVNGGQPIQHRHHETDVMTLLEGMSTPAQVLLQRRSGNIVHHEVAGCVLLEERPHTHNVRVIEPGERAGLLEEQAKSAVEDLPIHFRQRTHRHPVSIALDDSTWEELLDRHRCFEIHVPRKISDAAGTRAAQLAPYHILPVEDGSIGQQRMGTMLGLVVTARGAYRGRPLLLETAWTEPIGLRQLSVSFLMANFFIFHHKPCQVIPRSRAVIDLFQLFRSRSWMSLCLSDSGEYTIVSALGAPSEPFSPSRIACESNSTPITSPSSASVTSRWISFLNCRTLPGHEYFPSSSWAVLENPPMDLLSAWQYWPVK